MHRIVLGGGQQAQLYTERELLAAQVAQDFGNEVVIESLCNYCKHPVQSSLSTYRRFRGNINHVEGYCWEDDDNA